MKIIHNSSIDTNEIISDLITSLTHEDLIEFVKELDREVSDYDFTKELRDHFFKEMEEEDDEIDVSDYGDEE